MKAIAGSVTGGEVLKRRKYAKEFRRAVVKETLSAGSSVSATALKHRLNTNMLFRWRRQYLRELTGPASPKLLPVNIEGIQASQEAGSPDSLVALQPARHASGECIEIDTLGVRIRLRGEVDAQGLRTVLDVLSQR